MNTRRLGILGGTFDPIHFGHLDAGDAAQRALALGEVVVIPAHDPPHRPIDPRASAFHRFALAALAIDGRPFWRVSDIEVAREGPSYTIDTLRALKRGGRSASQLFFILGADAFAEIASWHEFPAVLDEANFAVVARPGAALDAAIARTPALATRLRRPRDGADGITTAIYLVEASTRDVSSTAIRERIGARLAIDDLVPAAVARHIMAHRLYVDHHPSVSVNTDVKAVDDLHGEEQRTQR